MFPPSNNELRKVADSKYAVVVAAAQRARFLSENHKKDENYRLSAMVTRALAEITSGRLKVICEKME
ncbi:MAG: DNA-directed RNA polymerase subunit omega [Methylocystaceae bacterium]